jgi:hypothetical protein
MKGIFNSALVATLVFSQVPAFGMQTVAMGLAKGLMTGAKQAAGRLMTSPQIVKAAQVAKQWTTQGLNFARQVGQKVAVSQVGTMVAKYPEYAILGGGAVAATGAGVAGAAHAANKKAAEAAAQAAHPVVAVPWTTACIHGLKLGVYAGWEATKNGLNWISATRPAQALQQAGRWVASTRVAQSMAKYPGLWCLGAYFGVCASVIGYQAYKQHMRNYNYYRYYYDNYRSPIYYSTEPAYTASESTEVPAATEGLDCSCQEQ